MARIPRRLAGIGAADLPDDVAFDAYIGPAREVTVDPVREIIALHDGVTPGGNQFNRTDTINALFDGDLGKSPVEKAQARANIGADEWQLKALFEPFPLLIDPDVDAALMPPKLRGASDAIYVMLTANKVGVGQYNEGLLINQSVSGSGALVQATAEIDLPGSPKHGATIPLINTERRFLRAGETGGSVEQDAFQDHYHPIYGGGFNIGELFASKGVMGGVNGSGYGLNTSEGNKIIGFSSGVPGQRVADETRVKNLAIVYFMRVQ